MQRGGREMDFEIYDDVTSHPSGRSFHARISGYSQSIFEMKTLHKSPFCKLVIKTSFVSSEVLS